MSFSNSSAEVKPVGLVNRLINGDFQLNPLGAVSLTDTQIAYLNWRVLTQSAAVQCSTLSNPEPGQYQCARITQTNSTAQRYGLSQTVQAGDDGDLRTAFLSLIGRLRFSATTAIRFALLEWTGTANSAPIDVVADWTSALYVPGQFFVSNVNVLSCGRAIGTAGTFYDVPYVPAQVGASMTNLILFVWTESTVAQNGTLDLGLLQFNEGTAPLDYEHRPLALAQLLSNGYSPNSSSVAQFGVIGDGQRFTTGATTSGSAVVNVTGASFTSTLVGKTAWVQYAAGGSNPLKTTVLSVNSATQLTLAANAGATVSNAIVYVGTDNTANINAMIASLTAGQQITWPHGIYLYSDANGMVIGNGSSSQASTLQDVAFIGEVGSTVTLIGKDPVIQQGTTIAYIGSTAATWQLDLRGPMRFDLANLCFDGNFYVNGQCNYKHILNAEWSGFAFINPKDNASQMVMGAYPGAASFSVFTGCSDSNWQNFIISGSGSLGVNAWVVGESTYSGGGGLDVSHNSFFNGTILISDDINAGAWPTRTGTTSSCIVQQFCDNNNFYGVFTYVTGQRRGNGAVIKPPSGSSPAGCFPASNSWYACPLIGGFYIDATNNAYTPNTNSGRGMSLYPLAMGDASDPAYTGAVGLPTDPQLPAYHGFDDAGVFINSNQLALSKNGVVSSSATALLRTNSFQQVANSSAETNIASWTVPAYTMQAFNYTLNANAYVKDRWLDGLMYGALQNNTGGAVTFRFRAYMGATNFFDSGAISFGASASFYAWRLDWWWAQRNALNSADTFGMFSFGIAGSGGGATALQDTALPYRQELSALSTDMTADQTLRLTVQMGTADAAALVNVNKRIVKLL